MYTLIPEEIPALTVNLASRPFSTCRVYILLAWQISGRSEGFTRQRVLIVFLWWSTRQQVLPFASSVIRVPRRNRGARDPHAPAAAASSMRRAHAIHGRCVRGLPVCTVRE